MSMILRTDRFKGNLVELLGRVPAEAERGLAPPGRFFDEGGRERLEWEETVEDSESGHRFSIFPTVRIHEGKVIEVGIRSDEYLFVLDFNEQGKPFFVAVPKEGEFEPGEVNWIREKDGKSINWEVSG